METQKDLQKELSKATQEKDTSIAERKLEILEQQNRGASNEIQLTDAIASRIGHSNCSGYKFSGERFDCGSKLGFIQANIKLSIQRPEMQNKLKSWLQDEILDRKI